jgi:hypothetical protein
MAEEVRRRARRERDLGSAMTGQRPTLEQQRPGLQLGTLAAPYGFRVIADVEGFPVVPGRLRSDRMVLRWREQLVVSAAAAGRLGCLLRPPATGPEGPGDSWRVLRHQSGDTEMRAVFAVEPREQVATVIRAKRWGEAGLGRPENVGLSPGQLELQAASSRGPRVAEVPLGSRRNRHDIDRPEADPSGAHDGLRAESCPREVTS